MKKIYVLLLIAFPILANAQTITQADLPTAGTAWTMNEDTNYVAAVPTGGTGQTWNFTSLLTNNVDTQAFEVAAGTPYASMFPSSNLSMYNASDNSYGYFTNSSTGLYSDGNASVDGSMIFNPPMLFIPVPFSYGSNTTNMARVQVDTSLAGQGYRIVLRFETTFEGDATGSLTIPTGTYNVLRIKTTQLVYDSILIELAPGTGIYTPFSGSVSQSTDYHFVSSGNAVNYIMGLSADSLGTTTTSSRYYSGQVNVSVQEPSTVKKPVAFPNPALDKIRFNTGETNAQIIIYDNSGREVNRVTGNVGNSIDVQSMTPGVYRYKIVYNDRTESGSFVVQH